MSNNEQDKLNHLIQRVEQHHAHVNAELAEIKLGLYGNKQNKVVGLIDRQEEDERRITNLENFRKKVVWFGSGFVVALQAIGIAVWEFFQSK